MIKCIPVITTNSHGCPKMAFDVTLVDTNADSDNIHYSAGGGASFQGKAIGKASVILERFGIIKKIKVLYFSGYRNDGKDFCVETEKSIIEECEKAAKAYWG